jgi:hypothetical protein
VLDLRARCVLSAVHKVVGHRAGPRSRLALLASAELDVARLSTRAVIRRGGFAWLCGTRYRLGRTRYRAIEVAPRLEARKPGHAAKPLTAVADADCQDVLTEGAPCAGFWFTHDYRCAVDRP